MEQGPEREHAEAQRRQVADPALEGAHGIGRVLVAEILEGPGGEEHGQAGAQFGEKPAFVDQQGPQQPVERSDDDQAHDADAAEMDRVEEGLVRVVSSPKNPSRPSQSPRTSRLSSSIGSLGRE